MITNALKKNHRWITVLRQISPMILSLSISHLSSEHMNKFDQLVNHLLTHKGEVETIRLIKSYRIFLQRYSLKQDNINLPFHKVDKDNFPKVLKPWKDLADGGLYEQRSLHSLWRLSELFRLPPSEDTSTITDDSTSRKSLIEVIVHDIGKTNFSVLPKELPKLKMNLSNKAGPNGPATLSAYADVRPLEEDIDLYRAVKSKLLLTKPKIDLDIHARRKIKGNFNHSKLVFLPDKSGKTRVIAIGDWWSNLALTDLHLAFMTGLKKLQGDCTYVQDKIPKLIKRMGPNLFSSDMSAFTDRFPIEIEEAIIKSRYGEEIGVLWRRILQRKFPSKDGYIQYKVGNPMGLLSSWAVSSFTHHYIKWWCRRKHPEVKGYKSLVLGDDSLCNNEEVYNTYLAVIKELGVSISHDKCSVSKNGYAEFAKRLFTPEGEITGIPVDILKGVRNDPSLFIELVKIMRNRGYEDKHIAPGVQSLLLSMPKKVMMTVLFVLSSSEDYTGMPPLVIGEGGALLVDPPVYGGLSEDSMKSHIEQAQREIFWREVDIKIHGEGSSPPTESPKQRSQMNIPKCHPAYADIQTGIYQYMYHGDGYNEFSIFEAWQQNKDFDLVNIPSMNPYKYTIRDQRVSEARYNVLKRARAFALGFQEYSTEVPMKISNSYLFHLAFAKMNE